jgi:DNA-binding transcriptional LysR family regulator
MWQTVELRELRLFLTLAEERHFGRTAETLQLTPSRVSQSLRALEQKLGAQLVHRTSRRVQLTPFGERFLRDVAPAPHTSSSPPCSSGPTPPPRSWRGRSASDS